MTWTKTGDDYPDRLLDRSDAAYRLHHAATTYCNRLGLDGTLPRARLSQVPVPPRTRRTAVVAELVAAGLWSEEPDGWQLADFFEAQPSAEEVALTRKYDAIRQRKRMAAAEKRPDIGREEEAARVALFEARERRRARSHVVSHSATHNAPPRPDLVPSRPKSEDEDKVATPFASASEARSGVANLEYCVRCGLRFEDGDPWEVRYTQEGTEVRTHPRANTFDDDFGCQLHDRVIPALRVAG